MAMPQAMPEVFICDAERLVDGGEGVRFPVSIFGEAAVGFVVRFRGTPYAYLNRCAHVPMELDWVQGQFFESGGEYLMCATHGAVYRPETGVCAGGPCRGGKLRPIGVREVDGKVVWQPDERVQPPADNV
jgi:nitrite reductase/ring-hydroxylating ferredoxin subunit